MQIGIVGLGRMGANMAKRLLRGGHECVAFDLDASAVAELERSGARPAKVLDDFARLLTPPRAVWCMVPAGAATDRTVSSLANVLAAGDVVIDGGNSYFKDDIARAATLRALGLHYVDVGTSGGVWGAERGYCLMIGGDTEVVERLDPIFRTLAPGLSDVPRTAGRTGDPTRAELGYLHCGPAGAGHFVKMVHNGIEYGLMQAYAEGFELMRHAGATELGASVQIDLADVAELWRRGSVVGSWLLDLTAAELARDPQLAAFSGAVSDSGEGRWTVQTAVEVGVPANVLSAALYTRFRSREERSFAEQMLSAMRHAFGGHVEPKK